MAKITCTLDEKDIARAIRELKQFKKDFLAKVDTYRKRIADEISNSASLKFASATMEHTVRGTTSLSIDSGTLALS